MAKIAIAIMLIFIASTHCELRDCSKEELVKIANKVNNAVLTDNLLGLPNFSDFDKIELIEFIEQKTKERGDYVQMMVHDELLNLNKLFLFPTFEAVASLPKDQLIELCIKVQELARSLQEKPFMGGLMDNISDKSTVKDIITALRSFVDSWGVPVDKIMDLAFQINTPVLIEAVGVKIDFLRALALGVEKMHNHLLRLPVHGQLIGEINSMNPKEIINRIREFNGNLLEKTPNIELLEAVTDIKCWEILANSKNLSGEELVDKIHAQLKHS